MKIDAFAHIIPPRYFERLDRIMSSSAVSERILGYHPMISHDPALANLEARWRAMDQVEGYVQVLTLAVPPVEELGAPDACQELARQANDEMAELVSAHPDRFVGFAAALPVGDVDDAVAELERAMGDLGARGALLYTNIGGAPLDARRFDPIFESLTRLGGALWIHPTRSPIWSDYPDEPRSKFGIWWSLGWPYETSACMVRLVYSGHFDRFEGLRVLTHHAGAMVPHFAARLVRAPVLPAAAPLRRPAIEYFKDYYADTAMFGVTHGVRDALEFFGPEHLLFGTDTPFGGTQIIREVVADVQALGLCEADLRKVFEDNARRVLGIRA